MIDRRNFGAGAAALAAVASGAASQSPAAPAIIRKTPLTPLPKAVGGVRVPDTELAHLAAELAWSASPDYLYNHCMRTYLFAALTYDKARTRYDEELVFLASILHDLGLVPAFMSPRDRFEVDGANAAETFLQKHNVPKARTDIVWHAIALHTGHSVVAARMGPEVASVGVGAFIDIAGIGLKDFDPAAVRLVLEQYPRIGFKNAVIEAFIELGMRKPMAQFGNFTAEICRAHIPDFKCPTFESGILTAPYDS